MPYARVAVNLSAVSGEYDYSLPDELVGQLSPGHLVTVPFRTQTTQGVVLELIEQPSVAETKTLIGLIDPAPVLTVEQIAFARQLAYETLNPVAAIVALMLPTGLSQQADSQYALRNAPSGTLSETQKRLLELLKERGALRGRQIDRHMNVEWRKMADLLVKRGTLTKQSILPPPTVHPKFVRRAQLAVTPEEAQAALPTLGKTDATRQRRGKALQFLVSEPDAVSVSWVYADAGCNLADLQELADRGLIRLFESEVFREPLVLSEKRDPNYWNREWPLNPDQELVLREIFSSLAVSGRTQASPYLLHGITGSGKTEIYLRATAETLRRGRTAIVLVPEIALTPQTVRRFLGRFPGQVGLLHSRLSEGERYDTWRRARSGKLKVIIGARSALFAPLPNVGLIVVDECHDHSYYQSDPPFYSATSAAMLYGQLCGAITILGSATPPVDMRYRAAPRSANGKAGSGGPLRLLELNQRVTNVDMLERPEGGLPPVSIVDMREELKAGNRDIFSRVLVESLAETLERGEQAILYLNRRGTATYVFCRYCGYVARCPNCETTLTWHADSGDLQCHRCGYARQMLKTCPNCRSTHIRAYGLGSEKVESAVTELFPQAGILRWDWETTREKDAHELILTHFANHQADVLVGTQMLAKGLDLPLVTLVGIVLADVGLALPDPFAGEKTFQLLTQVAGRAGRSSRGGKVILQTFMPENPVIQAAAGHDYAGFYHLELKNRHMLGYPPFTRLARLEYRHQEAAEVESQAKKLAALLRQEIERRESVETTLIGPVPCAFTKLGGLTRWQVVLRGPDPASILREIRIPNGWRVEVDPVSLL